jgi:hypothetical protein
VGDAKALRVEPISRTDADRLIKRLHYSGKVVTNAQLHLGVFYAGRLEGAMQFGPSLDKRRMIGLVRDTAWNGFIELNRMAFSDRLPRNSESRAMAVAFRLFRATYPHVEWCVSFSDATQCGDGTIYRAAGFVLTGIKKNTQIVVFPDGSKNTRVNLTDTSTPGLRATLAAQYGATLTGSASLAPFLAVGARALPGFQLRYVYFLNPSARARLSVPVIPFADIAERGASMYRGVAGVRSIVADATAVHAGEGGSIPTLTLHTEPE